MARPPLRHLAHHILNLRDGGLDGGRPGRHAVEAPVEVHERRLLERLVAEEELAAVLGGERGADGDLWWRAGVAPDHAC